MSGSSSIADGKLANPENTPMTTDWSHRRRRKLGKSPLYCWSNKTGGRRDDRDDRVVTERYIHKFRYRIFPGNGPDCIGRINNRIKRGKKERATARFAVFSLRAQTCVDWGTSYESRSIKYRDLRSRRYVFPPSTRATTLRVSLFSSPSAFRADTLISKCAKYRYVYGQERIHSPNCVN